jgi:hypothetical protein
MNRDPFILNLRDLMPVLNDMVPQMMADEVLKKDHRPDAGLTLINASKGLPSPKEKHQIPCKGLVVDTTNGKVVSLPYPKMYNFGENQENITFTDELLKDDEVRVVFPRKEDGTLIQVFYYLGHLCFTTRGVLEGSIGHKRMTEMNDASSNDEDSNADFLKIAKDLLAEALKFIDLHVYLADYTLIFELVCPESRVVTPYGQDRRLILTGILDRSGPVFRYLPRLELEQAAKYFELDVVEELMPSCKATEALDKIHALSNYEKDLLEGSVLQFEKDGEVIHRVKVKTARYLRTYRILKGRKEGDMAADLLLNPELRASWDAYVAKLRDLMGEEPDWELTQEIKPMWQSWADKITTSLSKLEDLKKEAQDLLAVNPDMKIFASTIASKSQDEKSSMFCFARGKEREAYGGYLRKHLPDGEAVREALLKCEF